jgi:hypothetical protein
MNLKDIITRYRLWIIIVPLIITFALLLPLTKAKINADLMEYLPDDIESKINIDRLESIFGKYEPIIIIFQTDDVVNEKTLERIQNISEKLEYLPEVDDVISLFQSKYIRGEDGAMLVDPAVRYIPYSPEERDEIRSEIINNPLAYKLLVSSDFKYTSIIVNATIGIPDDKILSLIKESLNEYPGNEQTFISGLPFLRHEIQEKAIRDLVILLPIGLLVMLIFLYISFWELRGVLLPFSIVVMSMGLAMGLMPLMGFELSIIAVLIPIMMIAIANNYGVHIIARYQELNAKNPDWSMTQIVNECITQLAKPIVLTGLTTIFGVMGLIVHIMLPAKQMGIVSSLAIGYALILSLLFIPAIMLRMNKGKAVKVYTSTNKTLIDKFLGWSGKISTKNPLLVIYAFVSIFIIIGVGIFKLQASINFERMMPKSHSLQVATNIANENFGGTKYITVLFEGDIIEPEVMMEMDRFETELEAIPEVGSVTSLASIIRLISKSLNEPEDEFYDAIPNDKMAIAQYIEFYSMSGNPEDFEKLVNFEYTQALLNIQFKAKDMRTLNRIENQINQLVKTSPYATLQAGQCLVEKEMATSIVRGQILSLIFAIIAIAILLWIIFRSYLAGIFGMLPLLITLVCNFGLMGWFGLDLDIGNSLLSSVAIGIGVDYTIHLFWRLKYEISLVKKYDQAIITTLQTTGRGIAINAFSVMLGFAVLFLSGLVILKTFAFLIIFSLLICLLCSLLLIPAISILVKPIFLGINGRDGFYE